MSQLHQFDQFDRVRPTQAPGRADAPWGEASLGAPPCTSLPDAELTRLVRSDEPIALEALDELRRRHLPGVLAYARICSRDSHAAEELADEAFERARKAVQASAGPKEAWRHHLLILVQHAAADWAPTTRRAELAPDFAAWLDSAATEAAGGRADLRALEARSLMPTAFRTLPERTRALLWHAVVEEDGDADTGHLLGLESQSVPYLREKAREAYRDAYLQAHTERHTDDECRRFSGLVEAAARRSGIHQSDDLDRHLAGCPLCSQVLTDLVGMSERPDAVLAEGLLLWGGAAYVAARLARSVTGRTIAVGNPRTLRTHDDTDTGLPSGASRDAAPAAAPSYGATPTEHRPAGPRGLRLARLARQFPALSATAAVVVIAATAATTIVTLVPSNSSTAADGGDPLGIPPLVVSRTTSFATVTATVSVPASLPPSATIPASASSGASHHSPGHGPSRRPTTTPSPDGGASYGGTGAPLPPPPTRGTVYSELVNIGSGLCLDVQDQFLEQGADVIAHSCTGATSQKWFLDGDHLLRNYANPDFCLDSRGATDRGVGVWGCGSADGSNGDNLRFQFASDGSIRPFIDDRFAVTPTGDGSGSSVALEWAEGRTDQGWRTGATAVLQQ